MFTVKELRGLVRTLPLDKVLAQLGPFVLIQRPEGPLPTQADPHGLPINVAATALARPDAVSQGTLGLLFEFEGLSVATLPPLQGVDELTVGRQPDCDLVLEHASVSKRHAMLRWNDAQSRCTLTDLGSTNGTFLNANSPVSSEITLKDGDIVSFGDVQCWYLLTGTLHAKLSGTLGSTKLGSHSG